MRIVLSVSIFSWNMCCIYIARMACMPHTRVAMRVARKDVQAKQKNVSSNAADFIVWDPFF